MLLAGSSSQLLLASPADVDTKLVMQEGAHSFEIMNDASEDKLVITDGVHDLVRLARESGDAWFRGDMTVGNVSGARSMTVRSFDNTATVAVRAGGSGIAVLQAVAHTGSDAMVQLTSGAKTFDIAASSAASPGQLIMRSGVTNLLEVAHTTGLTLTLTLTLIYSRWPTPLGLPKFGGILLSVVILQQETMMCRSS